MTTYTPPDHAHRHARAAKHRATYAKGTGHAAYAMALHRAHECQQLAAQCEAMWESASQADDHYAADARRKEAVKLQDKAYQSLLGVERAIKGRVQ